MRFSLHVHYDISCLFNFACLFSIFIFIFSICGFILIFSPLRLHQAITTSLRRPVTPFPSVLPLGECQSRRTVDRICHKLRSKVGVARLDIASKVSAAVIWVLENSLSGAVKVLCYLHQDWSNLWCIPITILLGSTALCILRPVAFLNGGVVMQISRAAHCVSL